MVDSPLPSDLEQLFQAAVDGSITSEGHRRLENILSTSAQARARYLTFIDNEVALENLHGIKEFETPEDLIQRLEQISSCQRRRTAVSWGIACVSVAVLALAILLGPWSQNPPVESIPLPMSAGAMAQTGEESAARLTQAAGAHLFGMLLPPVGTELAVRKEYTLVRGAIEITFNNGAVALMEAPSVFVVESPERLVLKTGNCSVHAPDGAEGFEVITPQSRVVDIGTRFSVNVNEMGVSEVHVIEGAAEVYSLKESQKLKLLAQGEARQLADHNEIRQIPFNQRKYRATLPDRVIRYEATPDPEHPGFVKELLNVTVQRGETPVTYQASDLIGIRVTEFVAEGDPSCVAWRGDFPDDPTDALRNLLLDTGLCNFGTIAAARLSGEKRRGEHPSDAGPPRMVFKFDHPVVNGPGPDVVLFDVQPAIHAPEGDAFSARPLDDLPEARVHFIREFDITMSSEDALRIHSLRLAEYDRAPHSLKDLVTVKYKWKQLAFPFYVLAVGIDLSDLGYGAGQECTGLVLEDGNDDRNFLDPVFIGGLPARID